jgi:hypothetical protein
MSATCNYCGKPVVWATDKNGTGQVLDPKPPVFLVDREAQLCERANGPDYQKSVHMGANFNYSGEYLVSHWATCPRAADVRKDREAKA